jgi:type VI secretion system Hcp family effector
MNAAVTNEVLTEVNFEFMKPGPQGAEAVYQTVKLTEATVSSFKRYTGHAGETGSTTRHTAADVQNLEDICFSFRKIEFTDADGHTAAQDSL